MTATPRRSFLAAPVTAISPGAFAFTLAFLPTEATATVTWPSAGTGIFTVAPATRTSRSVMGMGNSLVGFRPRAQVDKLVV